MKDQLIIEPKDFIKEAFRYKRQGLIKEVKEYNDTLVTGRVSFFTPVAKKVNSTATGEWYFLDKTISFLASKQTQDVIDSRKHKKDQAYMVTGGYVDTGEDTLVFFIEDLLPILPAYSEKQSMGRVVGVGAVVNLTQALTPYGKFGAMRQNITSVSPALNTWDIGVSQDFMLLGESSTMGILDKTEYYSVGSILSFSSKINLWGTETIDTKGEKLSSESTVCEEFTRAICDEELASKYKKLFQVIRGGMPLRDDILEENKEPKKLIEALFSERKALSFYPALNRGKFYDIKMNNGQSPDECLGISSK